PGLLLMVKVTLVVSVVASWLNWLSNWTVTAEPIDCPAVALFGCTLKTRWVAAALATSKLLELAMPRLPSTAVNVYPVAGTLSERLLKVATPPTAATVELPESDAPPGFVPRKTLTNDVSPGTWLP